MMLSNVDIQKALENGHLEVEPFTPRQIRAAGLTLHLGPHVLIPQKGAVVDPRKKTLPDYEEITISEESPYRLEPQEFILGHTYESITVGPQLGFFIEGRSTLARVGLTVVKTAMIVEPGHTSRTITLELANHGPNPIMLYPLMKIARVALYELKSPSTQPYDETGKYRNQTFVGRPMFDQEFLVE